MTWHRKIPGQAACGPCCGIKEKLQTLWDRTINSILRINQVEPDDQGNIRITSDSEALTVSEGTNEIILGLDTSELPAASVITVNGKRGNVVLKAGDITDRNNLTVQHDIDAIANDIQGVRNSVSSEAQDRQNADTALQNNINAVQASIPQEAAAAVAADPTVLSFAAAAADIPNKVDKRTGSGLRAYTHDGSTQDDTPVIDGTTGTTIPIRDSNGRLQAADPAAGATDKTLVTANWVSQTGDSAPNNLVHKSGNEKIYGNKDIVTSSSINELYHVTLLSTAPGVGWFKMFSVRAQSNCIIWAEGRTNSNQIAKSQYFIFSSTIDATRSHSPSIHILTASVAAQCDINNYAACQRVEDGITWIDYFINNKVGSYSGLSVKVTLEGRNGAISDLDDNIIYYANTAEDPTGYADVQYGNNAGAYKL